MFAKKLMYVAIGGALAATALPSLAGPSVDNRAVEVVGSGAATDPLIAIEANRGAIINRLVAEHAATLAAAGVGAEAFRSALQSLRADQLLAASLVDSVAEISAIVSDTPSNGSALQRFVAITPRQATSAADWPAAQAYLVRDGDALSIVRASDLRVDQQMQLVGYFVAPASTVVAGTTAAADVTPKDGSGTGANSWIGYVAGNNQANGVGSAVAAGTFNIASGDGSFVGAGTSNQANGISSLVIGGFDNRANAIDALVGAGAGHRADGLRSVIVGGGYNLASGNFSFIGGGGRDGTGFTPAGTDVNRDNRAFGKWSVIGGGTGNETGVSGAGDTFRSNTVAGGARNTASGHQAFIGGGGCNVASGDSSVVGGGGQSADSTDCLQGNLAQGDHSIIAGGSSNRATELGSTVGGGGQNSAVGIGSTVGGGSINTASGFRSTIAGGGQSTAIGSGSAVGGGALNSAAGTESTVAGGSGNIAGGGYSSVPGGFLNSANGDFSFAAGRQAKALAVGSFVFGDSTNADVTSNTPNQFVVAASGGIAMATNKDLSTGCFIAPGGGTWNCTSDRNAKRDFAPIAAQDILRKVAALPLSIWSYASEASGARHIGPMAQDFREAFGLGHDDRTIALVDAEGVALAAIQGLHQLMQEKNSEIAALKMRAETQQQEMAELRRTMNALVARSLAQ